MLVLDFCFGRLGKVRRIVLRSHLKALLPRIATCCEMEDEPTNKRGPVEPEPQEPPVNVDFISSLPDEMLVTIISHLPIKYGV